MSKNKNKNRHSFLPPQGRKITWRGINYLCLTLLAAAGAYYIFGANDLSVKGFEIYELKQRAQSLRQDHDALNLRITSLTSYAAIEERSKNLGLVAIDNLEYLSDSNVAVAGAQP